MRARGFVTVVYLLIALALEGVSVVFQWRADHGEQAQKDEQVRKSEALHKERSAGSQAEPSR